MHTDPQDLLTDRHKEGYLGERLYDGELLEDCKAASTIAEHVDAIKVLADRIQGDGKEEARERFVGFDRNATDGYGSWR